VIAMKYRLIRLQHGENDRSHAGDEELRNDDENVMYTLARIQKDREAASFPKTR
jgi:hypothetical protein